MRNIVGQIATKDDFFQRTKELDRLFRALDAGANIQIAAPRRVGKSSILYALKDNYFPNYHFVYVEVESARSKNEYFRKIYRAIVKCPSLGKKRNFWEQLSNSSNALVKRLKGISFGPLGSVEFNETAETNFEEELLDLLTEINLGTSKLVIMVDEFPEVILNIVADNKGDMLEARSFLQCNRAFRNHTGIQSKVQFIYAGSNSLNITVANLDASALINDLNAVPVFPMENQEGKDFVKNILANYGYVLEDALQNYLIEKVEWLIPFHLQLIIQEILVQLDKNAVITKNVINVAFANIFHHRNDHHFEHYVKRLKRIFSSDELKFVKLFLGELAKCEMISKSASYSFGNNLLSQAGVKQIMNALEHDGYIVYKDDKQEYRFNSPIIKTWWQKHEN